VKIPFCSTAFILALGFSSAVAISVQAQQLTYLNPVEMRGQTLQGSAFVAQHGSDGTMALVARI